MVDLFGITFTNPWYFTLLIPFIIFVVFLYKKSNKAIKFKFLKDVQKKYKGNKIIKPLYFLNIFLIGIVFIFFLANPTLKVKKITQKEDGIDINIILDLSYSMLASDLKPNRLEAAKKTIRDFISKTETDRVGLTVFAGKVFTSSPLSKDYSSLLEVVKTINIGTIDQVGYDFAGTAIGDAILSGMGNFVDSPDDRKKVIILLTDGVYNKGVNPTLAVKKAKEEGFKIYTIGIGKEKEIAIPEIRKIVEGIDIEGLKSLAKLGDGKFYNTTSNEELSEVFNDIAKLEKTPIEYKVYSVNKSNYYPFIVLLVLLFSSFTFIDFYYNKHS